LIMNSFFVLRLLFEDLLKTDGLPRIGTDETDLRTGKGKDEIQGSFAALRMTT